jgi:hypothetical protein
MDGEERAIDQLGFSLIYSPIASLEMYEYFYSPKPLNSVSQNKKTKVQKKIFSEFLKRSTQSTASRLSQLL